MCPRVFVQRHDPSEFYSAGPLAAGIARAGETFGRGMIDERKLDLEEVRAQAALAREQRMGAAEASRTAEHDADREAVVDEVRRTNNERFGIAAKEALKGAINSPGGALGPFGFLENLAKGEGAQTLAEVGAQNQADLEQAQKMSPAAGERFLKRRAGERKQEAVTKGYERESTSVQNALRDGKFEDPFLTPNWKPGQPPSEAAAAMAQDFTNGLQEHLNQGLMPGEIHKRIQQAYRNHATAATRYKAWEKADVQSQGLLEQIQELGAGPGGIDPVTGEDMNAKIAKRLADANGEWALTNAMTFRKAHDPGDSLAALKKILFGVEAEANPEGYIAANAPQPGRPFVPTQEQAIQAMTAQDPSSFGAGGPGGAAPPQRAAPVRGGRKTDTGARPSDQEIAAGREGRATERTARGASGQTKAATAPRAPTSAADQKRVRSFVLSRARDTFEAGGDRRSATILMLEAVEKELGIDPSDPKAFQIIQDALVEAHGR